MNMLKQKLRFTAAAIGGDVSPKTLRNWLNRYPLKLIADYEADGWTEFTVFDVAIIALMKELADWGVPVERANEIAFKTMMGIAHPLLGYKNTPVAAFVACFRGKTKFVWKSGSIYQESTFSEGQSADDLPQAMTVLSVDLEHLVTLAMGRLSAVSEMDK